MVKFSSIQKISILLLSVCLIACTSNKPNSQNTQHQTVVYTKDFDTESANKKYPQIIELYKDVSPKYTSGISHDEIYDDKEGLVRDVTKPILYAFKANSPNGYGVIILPGGGYYGVAMQREGFDVAKWFNDRGINAFVLKYRMPNKVHQIPLEDVERSYDIIKGLADEYGLDVSKVGVFGSSAGGHLAASYSIYSLNKGVPAFVVLLYPAISFDMQIANVISSRKNLIGDLENGHPLEIQYSLEKHVSSNTAPTFIVAAFDDKVVPLEHSLWYFNSLLKNNVKTSLHIYPEGGHGFGMNDFKYKNDFLNDLDSWLKNEIIK